MTNKIPNAILQKIKTFPVFQQKVYLATAKIPRGQTKTYGQIAAEIHAPGAARAVGTALGKNPFAPTIPCHRVVGSDGKMHGYSAPGGVRKKLAMLRKEGAY